MRKLLMLALLICAVLVVSDGTSPPPAYAADFFVNSTGDAGNFSAGDGTCETASGNGICTLRAAIEETNAGAGGDVIKFSIAGAGPHTISPGGSGLPNITKPVTIDGTTDDIILDGSSVVVLFVGGLQINPSGGGSTVKGLAITGFSLHGVFIANSAGNTIGGTGAGEGNVITNNGGSGILIAAAGATGNFVLGNLIGTDGFSALGNASRGVNVSNASSNTIGGTTAGERNVNADNGGSGVLIKSSAGGAAADNIVQGNFIGTKAGGASPLGNTTHGISISAGSGGSTADDNTIGGTNPGEGNIIAHNGSNGVVVVCAASCGSANGNSIRGNSIYSNGSLGISRAGGANLGQVAPSVTGVTGPGVVTGTGACAGCTVDVYSDGASQGRIHHGSAVVASAGAGPAWSFAGGVSGPKITATNTDAAGNTSPFTAAFSFSPTCAQVGVGTIITIAKGQSGKQNPKVSHSIAAEILDAADYGPTAHRIKICTGTAVTATITDLTGTPTNTTLSGVEVVCIPASCTVASLDATEKYKSVSSDGKDTDRVTLLPVP